MALLLTLIFHSGQSYNLQNWNKDVLTFNEWTASTLLFRLHWFLSVQAQGGTTWNKPITIH